MHDGSDPLNVYRRYNKLGLMTDGDLLVTTSQINRMNAPNSPKLAAFTDSYRTFKTYFLDPVIVDETGTKYLNRFST